MKLLSPEEAYAAWRGLMDIEDISDTDFDRRERLEAFLLKTPIRSKASALSVCHVMLANDGERSGPEVKGAALSG